MFHICLETCAFPAKISLIFHLWQDVEKKTSPVLDVNKNTLTGLANCKKTTRHHAHLSLCAKSRKTNDAMSRKWPNTSVWAIFWRFRGQISPNCKFFWKIGSFKLKVIFSTKFRPKSKRIVRAVVEKNMKVSDFGLIWRRFPEYL